MSADIIPIRAPRRTGVPLKVLAEEALARHRRAVPFTLHGPEELIFPTEQETKP